MVDQAPCCEGVLDLVLYYWLVSMHVRVMSRSKTVDPPWEGFREEDEKPSYKDFWRESFSPFCIKCGSDRDYRRWFGLG